MTPHTSTCVRAGRPEAAAAIWQWQAVRGAAGGKAQGRVRLRGCLQALAGAAVGLLLYWLSGSRVIATVVLTIAGAIALAALISPGGAYAAIERAFAALGGAVGRAMAALLMPLVFYAVFVPFGLLFRRGRRDSMRRFFEPDAATYWSRRERGRTASASRRRQY